VPEVHQHAWSQTSYGAKCLNCDAAVAQEDITYATRSSDAFGAKFFGSGAFGSPSNNKIKATFKGLPLTVTDYLHLVDYLWFAKGGPGIAMAPGVII